MVAMEVLRTVLWKHVCKYLVKTMKEPLHTKETHGTGPSSDGLAGSRLCLCSYGQASPAHGGADDGHAAYSVGQGSVAAITASYNT